MGSSKKHKEKDREHKRKHRHRSRSRERKRHKHSRKDNKPHEDEQEGYTHEGYDENYDDYNRAPLQKVLADVAEETSTSGGGLELSIEETNRIRAKLGLKPLEVNYPALVKADINEDGNEAGEDAPFVTEDGDVHKPAVNITAKKETDKFKEKMERMKEKRKHSQKLSKVKTLGESDSGDDVSSWVKKSRKIQTDKELAAKRAKMLEEMDAEFGIGNIVEQEFTNKSKEYTSKNLKGLKVQHEMGTFKEGKTVILTLQDKGVLDDDNADVLMNVNMLDDEAAKKNLENKKKKVDYKPYDEAEEDEYGMLKPKDILGKYDEEIEGEKKKSFELGAGGKYSNDDDRQMDRIRQQLREQSQTLSLPSMMIASEYYTQDEADAKFKKVKKKRRKIRGKALKADDLLPLDGNEENYGSRDRGKGIKIKDEPVEDQETNSYQGVYQTGIANPFEPDWSKPPEIKMDIEALKEEEIDPTELLEPDEDLTGVNIEEDEVQNELHSALNKARKVNLKRKKPPTLQLAEQIKSKEEPMEMSPTKKGALNIILNATSEFCRSLGDIPTYGQAGNREEDKDELVDLERELAEDRLRKQEEDDQSGWNRVEIDQTPVDLSNTSEKTALDDEPVVGTGVGAALQLANKKGYIEKDEKKARPEVKDAEDLSAQNYSIEDKRYDDLDEKFRKRDRYGGSGIITDFKEKDTYKPSFKLEYVDDAGRHMNQKEAFRQLSHRFHGKGSGKKKTEKRQKKVEEEQLMKQMSSTDTPLGTLNMLKEKQKSEKSAYILLSGNKGLTGANIAKSK